jgi:hypothetical protein
MQRSRLVNGIGYLPLLVVSLLVCWFHWTVFPRVLDGVTKVFAGTAMPQPFQLVAEYGWVVGVVPAVLLLLGLSAIRFERLAKGWIVGMLGGGASLVLVLYGFALSAPLLMQVLFLECRGCPGR